MLKNAFRHRTVDKTYHALVQGHPDPLEGTIDAPIGRHPKRDYKFAVMADGRHSVTHYETLEAHRFASLLEIHLETGRTHQIRVHMAALKHPCVGDLTYGADPVLARRVGLERQWLHAVRLGFEHPDSGDYVEYESSLPRRPGPALEVDPRCRTDGRRPRPAETAEPDDAAAIADLYAAARVAAVPMMPPRAAHRRRGPGLARRPAGEDRRTRPGSRSERRRAGRLRRCSPTTGSTTCSSART